VEELSLHLRPPRLCRAIVGARYPAVTTSGDTRIGECLADLDWNPFFTMRELTVVSSGCRVFVRWNDSTCLWLISATCT
jgi:hypothetical protein